MVLVESCRIEFCPEGPKDQLVCIDSLDHKRRLITTTTHLDRGGRVEDGKADLVMERGCLQSNRNCAVRSN